MCIEGYARFDVPDFVYQVRLYRNGAFCPAIRFDIAAKNLDIPMQQLGHTYVAKRIKLFVDANPWGFGYRQYLSGFHCCTSLADARYVLFVFGCSFADYLERKGYKLVIVKARPTKKRRCITGVQTFGAQVLPIVVAPELTYLEFAE